MSKKRIRDLDEVNILKDNDYLIIDGADDESKKFKGKFFQEKAEKNQPNGFAGLDENGQIPLENLPSINSNELYTKWFSGAYRILNSGQFDGIVIRKINPQKTTYGDELIIKANDITYNSLGEMMPGQVNILQTKKYLRSGEDLSGSGTINFLNGRFSILTADVTNINSLTIKGTAKKETYSEPIEDTEYVTKKYADTKVTKIDGKGLSTNDYTTEEKQKLASVAEYANVNLIEKITVEGKETVISDKTVNISKSDLGLENVDNTSDLEKPISTLQQKALNEKQSRVYTLLAQTEITADDILAAGEEGITEIIVGSNELIIPENASELRFSLTVPKSSTVNTEDGLLFIYTSESESFTFNDNFTLLAPQAQAGGCQVQRNYNITYEVVINLDSDENITPIYGTFRRGAYGAVNYPATMYGWTRFLVKLKGKKYFLIRAKVTVDFFKFPQGTTVKIYAR